MENYTEGLEGWKDVVNCLKKKKEANKPKLMKKLTVIIYKTNKKETVT